MTANLAANPAVGGIPVNDSRKRNINAAVHGRVRRQAVITLQVFATLAQPDHNAKGPERHEGIDERVRHGRRGSVGGAGMSPSSAYPACAMDEYASIRFMSVWDSASRLPTAMDSAASPIRMSDQMRCSGANATRQTRPSAARPAAFEPAARNAATGALAPW